MATDFSEPFFYLMNGRFSLPNTRAKTGTLTVTKQWYGYDGTTPLTATDGFEIPVIHVATEVPVEPVGAAMIDREKWRANNSAWSAAAVRFQGYGTAEPQDLASWTQIGVQNDDYPEPVYAKLEGSTLYYYSPSSAVYLPPWCDALFQNWKNLEYADLSRLNGTEVTTLSNAFIGCAKLADISLPAFDAAKLSNSVKYVNAAGPLRSMFSDCTSLTSVSLSFVNEATETINMQQMFWNCRNLTSVTFSGGTLKPGGATTGEDVGGNNGLRSVFYGCSSLETIHGLDCLDTSECTNMSYTFNGCKSLKELDLSGWDFSKVKYTSNMFSGCSALQVIYVASDYTRPATITNDGGMFSGCTNLIGGYPDGTRFGGSNNSSEYARIDMRENGRPGYFTDIAQKGVSSPASAGVLPAAAALAYAAPRLARAGGEAGAAVSVSMTSNSEIYVSDGETDTSDVYEQWIINEDGTWTYRFHIYDDEGRTYYVTEDALQDFLWFSMDEGKWYQEVTYQEGQNLVVVKNRQRTETPPPSLVKLRVEKRVEGDTSLLDGVFDSFSFKVVIGEVEQDITLADGESWESAPFESGTPYTVREVLTPEQAEVYTARLTSARGTEDGVVVAAVTCTNTVAETGSLVIGKTAEAAEGVTDLDPEKTYRFTITLLDGAGSPVTGVFRGSQGALLFDSEGQAAVSLKSGETFDLADLPAGTRFTVTEEAAARYRTEASLDGGDPAETLTVSGLVSPGGTSRADFTNTKTENDPTGGFTLRKALGPDTAAEEAFSFVIRFTGLTPGETYAYIEAGETRSVTARIDGTAMAEVRLAGGETADFSMDVTGLPAGAAYTIVENASDYIASYTAENQTEAGTIMSSAGGNTAVGTALSTAREAVEDREETAVVFTNASPAYSVLFGKYAAGGNPLSGAELALSRITLAGSEQTEEDGGLLRREAIETDEPVMAFTSAAELTGLTLKPGRYLLTETEPPEGYLTAPAIRFDLTVDGFVSYWNVNRAGNILTELPETGYTNAAAETRIQMVDEPVTLRVLKTDGSGAPLANAVLQVLRRDTDPLTGQETETVIEQWATDASGARTLTGRLALDTPYILREANPPAGMGRAEDIWFRLVSDGSEQGYHLETSADGGAAYEPQDELLVTMVDYVHVVLKKVGVDSVTEEVVNDALAGAVFTVYLDGEHKVIAADVTGRELKDLTSDEVRDGDTVVKPAGLLFEGELADGTYYLVETTAPDGYSALPEHVAVRISGSGVEVLPASGSGRPNSDAAASSVYTVSVKNYAGYELPVSGGTGTGGVRLLGAALAALALAMLAVKKRRIT